MTAPLLEISGITKRFGGGESSEAGAPSQRDGDAPKRFAADRRALD
jgi:hypothetical protein